MKYRLASPFSAAPRAATFALVAALGAGASVLSPALTPHALAVPKPQLQIWPDRRVILVLPLQVSPTWNADPQLGQAILPLAQPQLQSALGGTGKFSVTLPYRFDPVLRRGLAEKQIAENDLNTLLSIPTLASSRPVIDKLNFDQPVMTTEVFLEELTVGGDSKKPTVQIQVSGRLYQQGSPNPVKTETYRSRALGGKTPSERLTAATRDAFDGLAAAFVQPPDAFNLLAPIEIAPPVDPKAKPAKAMGTSSMPMKGGMKGGMGESSAAPMPMGSTEAPAPLPAVVAPSALPGTSAAPLVPQLPTATPPLGVTAGEGATAG